tara:strand:- start:60 stop:620 length:561 start_codon:yes stop_codon:yes gene_type:complete
MNNNIRICAILGTGRPYSYTGFAMQLVINELKTMQNRTNISVDFISPSRLELVFPGEKLNNAESLDFKKIVADSDGLVFGTPEYHGSIAAYAKLIIENLGFPSVLKDKPVSLLGCAAGSIGAIKALEQLRTVLSHVGALPLPRAISIPNVQKVFNSEGICIDPESEIQIRSVASQLITFLDSKISY